MLVELIQIVAGEYCLDNYHSLNSFFNVEVYQESWILIYFLKSDSNILLKTYLFTLIFFV